LLPFVPILHNFNLLWESFYLKGRDIYVEKSEIEEYIDQCKSALSHLNHAIRLSDNEYNQKLEHACKDIEESIMASRQKLQ